MLFLTGSSDRFFPSLSTNVNLNYVLQNKEDLGSLNLFFSSIGGFICIYVGNLYTNEEANKQGQDFGDEYFAELDLIEVVEGRKEGNF